MLDTHHQGSYPRARASAHKPGQGLSVAGQVAQGSLLHRTKPRTLIRSSSWSRSSFRDGATRCGARNARRNRWPGTIRPHERRFLFVAGGTGIAPVDAQGIRDRRASGGRACSTAIERPADFPYLRELRGLAQRLELSLHEPRQWGPNGVAECVLLARAARRLLRHPLLRASAVRRLMGLGISRKTRILDPSENEPSPTPPAT